MDKLDQLDFWLIRKVEANKVPSLPPMKPMMTGTTAKVIEANIAKLSDYRDYWFERGRQEAFMEVRVALRNGEI